MKSREKRTSFATVRGQPTPLLVFGAMLCASLAFRCSGKSDSNDGDVNGGSSGQGGSSAQGGSPAQGGSSAAAGWGTGGDIPQGGSAGAPTGPCTEANVTNDCPLPPSVCQDPSSMAYYSDVQCVSGQCAYTLQVYRCPGSCSSGACTASTTTASGPPPDSRCVGTAGSSGSGGQSSGTSPVPGGAGGAGSRIIIGGAGAMGGTNGCDLPPSVCNDERTLVYYTEPRCENLQCVYTTNTLDCMGSCSNGACQGGFTAPAPP